MVLVHVGSVVVLTTGKTTTTGVLAVLTDTTVTGRDVTAVLAGVGKAGRHLDLLLPWVSRMRKEKKKPKRRAKLPKSNFDCGPSHEISLAFNVLGSVFSLKLHDLPFT